MSAGVNYQSFKVEIVLFEDREFLKSSEIFGTVDLH